MSKPTVVCKGDCGKSFEFTIDDSKVDLTNWFMELHKQDRPNVDVYDYAKAVNVCNAMGGKILLSTKWNELVQNNNSIHLYILRKSWTIAPNFDEKTFTAVCAITLDKCQHPASCPQCLNAFERKAFQQASHCPICCKKNGKTT
jgi:hypothetical protein